MIAAAGTPVAIKWSPYIPHAPETPQHAFLLIDWVLEALYGGAAGGGKSDALLMGALQYTDVPGYAAILFRRTYTDLALPDAIMARSHEWLAGSGAKWNETEHQWTFPSGATLNFGYLKSQDDKYRYKSAAFQYIGFDEVTEFREEDYTYLFSRLRGPDHGPLSKVPLRMRSASNPGGRGAPWVRRRFPVLPGHTPHDHEGRVFIPARLDDNPHINQETYLRSLSQLDEQTQLQLIHGDWTARPPGPWAFNHLHLDAAVALGAICDARLGMRLRGGADPLPEPVGSKLMNGNDFGEAAHTLLGWPLERNGYYVCFEHVYAHSEPDIEAVPIVDAADRFGYEIDRGRFDASKPESMRLFVRKCRELKHADYAKPSPVAFSKYKRQAILHIRKLLRRTFLGYTTGVLALSPARCPVLIEEMYDLQFKGEDTEDLVKENDHGPDALFALVAPESRALIDVREEVREAA